MAIIAGNDKIKKGYTGSTKLKRGYTGSTKVWSGASLVTYIYANLSTQEEVDEGDNCATKTVTISDATFLGWTDTRGATTPVDEILATGDPMTLYAIYKYDDTVLSTDVGTDGDTTWSMTIGSPHVINKLAVNGEKYSNVTITVTGFNVDTAAWTSSNYCTVHAGASNKFNQLVYARREGATPEYFPDQVIVSRVSTPYTFNVDIDAGIQYVQIKAEGGWYSWSVTISTVVAKGKTVCS